MTEQKFWFGDETAKTKQAVEIKAGELNLSVPYTTDGLRAVRAMVAFLEAELIGEREIKSEGGLSPKSEMDSGNPCKTGEGKSTSPFSPPITSSKQRIKFKNWEAIATAKSGTLYKEVVDRFLIGYKDGIEPSIEMLSQIIREMYGTELKGASIATYVSQYKRYIRENKLAEKPIAKTPLGTEHKKPITLREIPMEQVAEIWNLLPEKFSYKQAKALITTDITQSGARIDAANYVIREFKENPAFGCEETSPGIFLKRTSEKGEEG